MPPGFTEADRAAMRTSAYLCPDGCGWLTGPGTETETLVVGNVHRALFHPDAYRAATGVEATTMLADCASSLGLTHYRVIVCQAAQAPGAPALDYPALDHL